MATSEARILANQRNALLSTGPKTLEGKEKSRANALKHGLCSSVLVPEDLEAIQQRTDQWFYSLKPQNPHQAWQVGQVAVISLRIDRCERIERRLRDRAMLRAELAWDDDRMLEVENIGSRLNRRPSEFTRQLRATPQGCDWLIARWEILAEVASKDVAWTTDQTRLAFDLLGTPLEGREGRRPGDLVGDAADPPSSLALARRRILELRDRKARVAELDEVDKTLVTVDQFDERNPELKRLRRYEATLHTRLRWFVDQIKDPKPHVQTHADLRTHCVDRIGTEPELGASRNPVASSRPPHPPFDLEPDEIPPPGQDPDIPRILHTRLEKKIRKAESRRDAKRRKTEKMRA